MTDNAIKIGLIAEQTGPLSFMGKLMPTSPRSSPMTSTPAGACSAAP